MKDININTAFDYVKYQSAINALAEDYPFLQVETIGKSVMGKSIHALRIGRGYETVLFAAAFHGSEHITTNISLKFCERLCRAILTDSPLCEINVARALRGRSVVIIPRVNPDGCDISVLGEKGTGKAEFLIKRLCEGDYAHYNANARGVDINHNFSAGWHRLKAVERTCGINYPSSRRFGGYAPESEPETAALVGFCRRENVSHALALHTQGEVIYWNYGEHTPEKSKRMAEILASVSGYALDVPAAIATGGGFKDYFIEEYRRPAFTVELGLGENPLPEGSAFDIYEKAEEMLTIAAIM